MSVLQRYKIENSTLGACKQKIWYHSVRPRSPRPYLPVGNNNDDDEISGMKHELTNRNSRLPRHQSQNTMHVLGKLPYKKQSVIFFSWCQHFKLAHRDTTCYRFFFFFQLRVNFSLRSLLDGLPHRSDRKLEKQRQSWRGKPWEVWRTNYAAI